MLAPRREDVEMIGTGGAACESKFGKAGLRGSEDHGFVEAGPDRVQGLEPGKERLALTFGEAPGQRLVEMVMGVHQARNDHRSAAVDGLIKRFLGGLPAERGDPTVLDPNKRVRQLASLVVHGRDKSAILK